MHRIAWEGVLYMQNEFEFTPFTTAAPKPKNEPKTLTRLRVAREKRHTARTASARSMWVKIGLCGAFLMAVILLELALFSGGKHVETSALEQQGGSEEETPGKLQFVSETGAVSVFSGVQRWSSPVNAENGELLDEGGILRLAAAEGDTVRLPAAGQVKEIGEDDALGIYVRVRHGAALESVYYGIGSVSVEEGQPLLAGDTLGTVDVAGEVLVMVLENGQRRDPTDYISVSTGG